MVNFWKVEWDFPHEDEISLDILEFIKDENGKWVDSGVNAPTYNDKIYEAFWNIGHQWYQIMNRSRKKPKKKKSPDTLNIRL